MSTSFSDDMSQSVAAVRKHAKAWLGAIQYEVYADRKPAPMRRDADGEGRIKSDVARSPEAWFDGVNGGLDAALRSAEGALSNQWAKQRDPRFQNDEAREEFAHQFEDNVAAITRIVLDMEKAIDDGVIPRNRAMDRALGLVKNDLRRFIRVYEKHRYELTMQEQDNGLLSLRAQIMDGWTRPL